MKIKSNLCQQYLDLISQLAEQKITKKKNWLPNEWKRDSTFALKVEFEMECKILLSV